VPDCRCVTKVSHRQCQTVAVLQKSHTGSARLSPCYKSLTPAVPDCRGVTTMSHLRCQTGCKSVKSVESITPAVSNKAVVELQKCLIGDDKTCGRTRLTKRPRHRCQRQPCSAVYLHRKNVRHPTTTTLSSDGHNVVDSSLKRH
jgi:hypothetical protein